MFTIKKHSSSLTEDFQCHYCLESNEILPSHGWDGELTTEHGHSEFVVRAGHSVIELGSRPIFSTVAVALCHYYGAHEWRRLQLTEGTSHENGSEETAQTSCCAQARVHAVGGQAGQVKVIELR